MIRINPLLGLVAVVSALLISVDIHIADPIKAHIADPIDARVPGPTIEAEVQGLKVTAPSFENNFYVTEKRKKFDNETIHMMLRHLKPVLDGMVEKRSHARLAYRSVKAVPAIKRRTREHRALQLADDSQITHPDYPKKMGELMESILSGESTKDGSNGECLRKDSNNNCNKPPIISDAEVKKRVDVVTGTLGKLVEASPTGLYIDWSQCKIGDQPLADYLKPVIPWMRKNGYGIELYLFKHIAYLLKNRHEREKPE